jgi:two-component system sensor histidine kinase ChiS
LHNLISNAIKFTDEGFVHVIAEKKQAHLFISVKDSGIGIPAARLHDVFKSFEQIDGSIERNYGGTGLGLAVSKQLVELHQGEITVSSDLGKGSTFTFSIPLASEEAISAYRREQDPATEKTVIQPAMVDWAPDELLTTSSSDGAHLLIVDDEPVNLHVLVNHLSQHDFNITTATSGVEALALLKQGLKPDIILLDVMMPKLSGYEVTRTIRKTFTQTKLPILLLSAKNEPEDIATGFKAGANDYLTKPFSKIELIARIEMQMNIQKALRLSAGRKFDDEN